MKGTNHEPCHCVIIFIYLTYKYFPFNFLLKHPQSMIPVLMFPQPVSNASDQFLGLSQAIYLRSFILANIAVIISG